jgi:hypothetical protein
MINNPHQIHGRGMWHVGGEEMPTGSWWGNLKESLH